MVCCRNLCPQQPKMADLPELLQVGDKDLRSTLRGRQALAVPTKFPLFARSSPCCLPVSVDTCHPRTYLPQLYSHFSLQECHLSILTPDFACQIPTFFPVAIHCYLHAAASGPSLEKVLVPCVCTKLLSPSHSIHMFSCLSVTQTHVSSTLKD